MTASDFDRALKKVEAMQLHGLEQKRLLKEQRDASVERLKTEDPVLSEILAREFAHPMLKGASLVDIKIQGETIYHREVKDSWVDPLEKPILGGRT